MFDCLKKKVHEAPVKTPEKLPPPPPELPVYRPSRLTDAMVADYETKWSVAVTRDQFKREIDQVVTKMLRPEIRRQHEQVAMDTGVPVNVIAVTHMKESSLNFSTHLHNGDSLNARTWQVPSGRPVNGNPPFTWYDSAVDAINYEAESHGIQLSLMKWDVANTLFWLETYNGWGYRSRGINSPYLWSYSSLYTKGLYVRDGIFDPEAVSRSPGCVCILKALGHVFEV